MKNTARRRDRVLRNRLANYGNPYDDCGYTAFESQTLARRLSRNVENFKNRHPSVVFVSNFRHLVASLYIGAQK